MTHTLDPSTGVGDADDQIVVRGVVDAAAGAQLGVILAQRLAAGTDHLAVDLSAVEAVDEQGLVALVRLWHELAADGRSLVYLDPSPALGPLLAMTGVDAAYRDR